MTRVKIRRQAETIEQLTAANEALGAAAARLTRTAARLTEQLAAPRGVAGNTPTALSDQVPER